MGELWQCPRCGERFVTPNMWHSCGKFTLDPLLVGFGFARRRESPRFHKINQYAPRWYTHEMRLASGADFDEEFLEWIRESYAVGEQRLGG